MPGHPRAEAFKAEGNKYFKSGDYKSAISKYKEATAVDPNVPAYWSNMAACYEKIGGYDEMEEAARSCIKADKSFVKGYFRLATALKANNDLQGCIKALESGLAVDSANADLKRMKKDLTELQRGDTVAAYIRKCEEQTANGDIAGAYKTLELASRLDAGNPDLERMMSRVKPKYERMEANRRANLSSDEVQKEKGDAGLGPEKTSFFQALSIATKIARGTIEILNKVHLIKKDEKVGASEATLLQMLKIYPFSYGLQIRQVYDSGAVFHPSILDLTDQDICNKFSAGVANVAAICLEIGYPTAASAPHSIVNGFKNLLAIAVSTDIEFPQAEQAKAFLADPSAFLAAAAAAAPQSDAKQEETTKQEESEEESDDDMGFGLFD